MKIDIGVKGSLIIFALSLITLMIMHPIIAFQSLKQYRKNKKLRRINKWF